MSNSTVKGEDEDELESLRLAALESLRAKGLPPPSLISLPPKPVICSNQASPMENVTVVLELATNFI